MSKYPNLSDADRMIMEILWRDKVATSAAIYDEVGEKLDWSSKQTVRTYLKRLMDRNLVNAKEIRKKVYGYYPIVIKEEYIQDKTGSFFNKYYDNLSNLVAGILETESIADADLDNLEKIIREARKKEDK